MVGICHSVVLFIQNLSIEMFTETLLSMYLIGLEKCGTFTIFFYLTKAEIPIEEISIANDNFRHPYHLVGEKSNHAIIRVC